MERTLSDEVYASLRTLELKPGATAADIRSAFRRLARTCHPDVAGLRGAFRFQQITGAYSLLKGLSPDELTQLTDRRPVQEPRPTLFDWYKNKKRRESENGKPEARESREAERRDHQRIERVNRILNQYDRSIARRLERMEQDEDQERLKDLLPRLKSPVPEVRRLALGRMGRLANHSEIRQSLAALLSRFEVDGETARLVAGLPLEPDVKHRLASEVAEHAAGFPDFLISSLLGLRSAGIEPDLLLMERYLTFCAPSGAALILRYWPKDRTPSDTALWRLLESDDPQVLVPVLVAMKQKFPQVAARCRKRLTELKEHPFPAVRLWSRSLIPG